MTSDRYRLGSPSPDTGPWPGQVSAEGYENDR